MNEICVFIVAGAKLEHMLALREEVEQEYADRMEELRNMYRVEMDSQNDKTAKERERAHAMELSLSESLKVKREEADTFRAKSDELDARVAELTRRLDNQTAEVIRLQGELEEYEYGGGGGGGAVTAGDTAAAAAAAAEYEDESEYEEAEDEDYDGRSAW